MEKLPYKEIKELYDNKLLTDKEYKRIMKMINTITVLGAKVASLKLKIQKILDSKE